MCDRHNDAIFSRHIVLNAYVIHLVERRYYLFIKRNQTVPMRIVFCKYIYKDTAFLMHGIQQTSGTDFKICNIK